LQVTITLPDYLPAGQAVLRWDWSALHTWPSVEFYSQCIDLQIAGSSNSAQVSDFDSYSIVQPPIYPLSGRDGIGFRCPFQPNTEQYMTGTACAFNYAGNNCELTKSGTTGFTGGGAESATPGGGGGSDIDNGSDGSGADMTPVCTIYTVVAGDTLSSIAEYYRGQGVDVTWQQICSFNDISGNCDAIDIGDTYTIPNTCKTAGPDDDGSLDAGGMFLWIFLVALFLGGGVYFVNHQKNNSNILTTKTHGKKPFAKNQKQMANEMV